MRIQDVDTPSLIIELDSFENNIQLMSFSLDGKNVHIRPHAKSHKCPEIAHRQIAAGAVGICCQKVSEAEAMINGGIADVLVSNEVVGKVKLERLAALAKRATVAVCTDNLENVKDLGAVAHRYGVILSVLVEVDVGGKRCGVEPGASALALAKEIIAQPNLRFGGLQGYHGSAQHIRSVAERRLAIDSAAEEIRKTLGPLEVAGIPCPRVTGAGTGSYLFEAASRVYTELQPGSYIFMDADYARNEWAGSNIPAYEQSLFLWTTVMSTPVPERAVVDAGLKALSVDSGLPLVADLAGVEYTGVSDEHGTLSLPGNSRLRLGDKIRLSRGSSLAYFRPRPGLLTPVAFRFCEMPKKNPPVVIDRGIFIHSQERTLSTCRPYRHREASEA
ncbi:MAG: DSD1 family PLP-dependent enzyme [Ignavibacteriales bacterium]|nr:DSD1 family PLP-dependent enzyme [Ignavibacteriales bacterium]